VLILQSSDLKRKGVTMKSSNLKLILWVILVCMVFSVMGCFSIPKADGGIELNPQGDLSPFEGLWEVEVDAPRDPNMNPKNRTRYTAQLMFHLNTWEDRSDLNALDMMSPTSSGTFTYTENTITMVTVNILYEGMNMSVKSMLKGAPKSAQEQMQKGVTQKYELNGDELLIIIPAMNGQPEQRRLYKKVQ